MPVLASPITANGDHTWTSHNIAGVQQIKLGSDSGAAFDGANVTVKIGTVAVHADLTAATAGVIKNIELARSETLTFTVAGGGGSISIPVSLKRIRDLH